MPSIEEYLLRADELAQTVMDEWVKRTNAGQRFSVEFKNLADRADDYIKAKRVADNHRQFNSLTDEEAAEELTTRRAFAETYKKYYEKRQGA